MGAAPVLELHAEPGTAILQELRAARERLDVIEHRLLREVVPTETTERARPALNDDTVVDQRSVPAPRDLYLRLARAKAFPSHKIAKGSWHAGAKFGRHRWAAPARRRRRPNKATLPRRAIILTIFDASSA